MPTDFEIPFKNPGSAQRYSAIQIHFRTAKITARSQIHRKSSICKLAFNQNINVLILLIYVELSLI